MKLGIISLATLFSLAGCGQKNSSSSSTSESEVPLGATLIATLPLAEENEFPTPEAGARAFVQGLIDDNWDQVLRATPLRLECERVTFETRVKDMGVWNVGETSGDPSSPMATVTASLGTVRGYLALQKKLMGEDELGGLRRIENPDDPKEIAEAKKRALYSKPPNLTIAKVEFDADTTEKMSTEMKLDRPMLRALGVVDAASVNVFLEGVPREDKSKLQIFLYKIDSNWLVFLAN